ncbi:hypothetical protein [Hymenobacter terrenus]|uniref:hypothetical protein n=1 Tax=Hymenobacter terrenus TaxID=1629124 RepID=UPI000619A4CD|nr:hypothetical protein [Hymenobacter terrenus]
MILSAACAAELGHFRQLLPDFQVFEIDKNAVGTLATQPAVLIGKYYPNLGQHLPSPTLPELAAEWYSDLSRLGKEGLDYYVTAPHERASNKEEFLTCLAMLLAEAEQHAHLPGYGYRRHYTPEFLTPQRESELEASGRAALRAVREWHTLASLTPIEQFLHRARKIELWENERYQLATREDGHEEWSEEYGVMLLALQRAVPTAKKKLLRAAYTELKRLLPTIEAGRPLKWQRLYDEGRPFFASTLTATYAYSEFTPLRPTQNTTSQIKELFFQYLHVHLFEKEWHVWQALILLAGALGEAAPPTPETFRERQTEPALATLALDVAPPDAATIWASLLCKNVKYTLENLDELLVSLALLTDAASRTPTPEFKGSAVLGAVKALRERRYLRTANNAKLARLLAERYGTDAANPHTVKRGTEQLPEPATPVYTRALALLPAP